MLDSDNSEIELEGFDSFELTLGDKMRGERATLGKSLSDISEELKIRKEFLSAVEDCDLNGFPSPSFAAGYVRSYAEYLGLCPDECYLQFCRESGFTGLQSQFSEEVTNKPAKKNKETLLDEPFLNPYLNKKSLDYGLMSKVSGNMIASIATLTLFLGGLGYLGHSMLKEVQRVSFAPVNNTVSSLQSPTVLPQPVATAEIVTPEENDQKLAELYRPTSLETPILTPRVGPISNINPDELGIFATAKAAEVAVEAPVATEATEANLRIYASEPAWVRVYNDNGAILFEKILNKGQSYEVTQGDGLILRAGNSGAVYFALNGAYYGPVGTGGSVVDDVKLQADGLDTIYARTDKFDGIELEPPVNAEIASAE